MGLRMRLKPGPALELTPGPDLGTGLKPVTESGVELEFCCEPEL